MLVGMRGVLATGLLVAAACIASSADATTITALTSFKSDIAPGLVGYDLFNVTPSGGGGGAATLNGTPNDLFEQAPGVSTIDTAGDSFTAGATQTTVLWPALKSGVYTTGIAYQAGMSAVLATITLNGDPNPFDELEVLTDNGVIGDQSLITVASGNSIANLVSSGVSGTNNLYLFKVDNIAAGDTITVTMSDTNGTARLGGLGFSECPSPPCIPVPEPASGNLLAANLLAVGALTLFGVLRRQSRLRCRETA